MDLVTDIARVRVLAEERKDENWRFFVSLKERGLLLRDFDRALFALREDVVRRIDCTACANCCRVLIPILRDRDVRRLSRHLRLPEPAFRERYLGKEKDKEDDGWPFAAVPCPFLQGNRCGVYPARPRVCRTYPNLHQRDALSRMGRFFSNCAVCPIVFNVYEALKRQFRG